MALTLEAVPFHSSQEAKVECNTSGHRRTNRDSISTSVDRSEDMWIPWPHSNMKPRNISIKYSVLF